MQRESDQIAADQNRIRENMKVLKGTCEEKALLQSYLGQLDSQESRMIMGVSADESYSFDGLRKVARSPACT